MVIGIDASRAFVGERTGTEEYAYQLVRQLVRLLGAKNHRLVLYVRPNAAIPEELRQKDVRVVPIPLRYLWTQVGLAGRTWIDRLDLLFVPAHTLPLLRRPGIKTVVTIHGLEYRWLPEYRNWLQRWYLPLSTYYATHSATGLIAVSQATKRDLVRELGIAPARIEVISEGATVGGARAGGGKPSLVRWQLKRKRYILFVGSLQPRKNLPALVAAFAKFYKTHPDYKLVIAGSIGWMSQDIFGAPGKFSVQEAVVFTGRVSEDDKRTLLANASMYVQPSWTEGFGLPVVEAMEAGTACIVSSGGALPEVVGEEGLVVQLGAKFVPSLAEAMRRAVDEAGFASELVTRGYKRVQKLNWEQAGLLTMRLFERVYAENN